jgi:hypothetical protein
MRNSFPLFQSHLDLAHQYWSQIVQTGDTVIDATCGNGHDTLKLCQLALSVDKGKVYAIDIQEEAINSCCQLLDKFLPIELKQRVSVQQRCHSSFPETIVPESVKLIVYNLGYLPKGNKSIITLKETTLKSIQYAEKLIALGGVICITCYPGHEGGLEEQEDLLNYAAHLSPSQWSCCHHHWLNRHHAPSLLLMQKKV